MYTSTAESQSISGLMVTLMYQNILVFILGREGKSSSVTTTPMKDRMEKYFIVIKLCWAVWVWQEKEHWIEGRQGDQRGEDTQMIIRTFCLGKIHPGSILQRNIGFEEKKCRFMACQRLIIFVILLYLLNCSYQKNKKPGKRHFNTANWTTFWAHFSPKMFLTFTSRKHEQQD